MKHPRNAGGQDILAEGAARLIHPVTVTTTAGQLSDYALHTPTKHGTLRLKTDAHTRSNSSTCALTKSCDAHRHQSAANCRARAGY